MMFNRLNLRALHSEDMALTLILWLCSLPLVGLVVAPVFGLKVAVVVAVVLFFAAMAICWGICGWRVVKD
ncbi:MAG: hypothetical protein EHM35_11175 [Planctomycetaceae bacterium]|nr:MAG: hypothetical protein EHM35_11175 [Planctomycetaceae bacterium]